MRKQNKIKSIQGGQGSAWGILLVFYAVAVLVRFCCALLLAGGPTVYIDEGLYINIARSIFNAGEVLYRGQPVDYTYLVYPLALLPLFLLPATVNIYRAVQLWNCLMACSIVFPTYLLAKKFRLSRSQSLWMAAVSLLLPELSLTMYLVAESLIYPCMLWLFLFAFYLAEKPEKRMRAILFGFLGGMMYFAKPQCLVFPACFLVVSLFWGIRAKQSSRILNSVLGLAGLGAAIALGYGAYQFFFGETTVLNLYEKQIPEVNLPTVGIMIQGTIYHIIAFFLCTGTAMILLPFMNLNKMKQEHCLFFLTLLVCVLTLAVGIGIMVVPLSYTGTWSHCPVHTRYISYFLLPLVMGLFLPEQEKSWFSKKASWPIWVLTALFLLPGPFLMYTDQAGSYDAPALNLFNADQAGYALGLFALILLTICNVNLIRDLLKNGFTVQVRKIALVVVVCFFTVNGVMAYHNRRTVYMEYNSDTQSVVEALEGEEYLVIINNIVSDVRTFQLDCHIQDIRQMVAVNDFLLNAANNNGSYVQFSPTRYNPNTSTTITPDVSIFLFETYISNCMEFAPGVSLERSPNEVYTIARFTKDEPVLKTALSSLERNVLNAEDRSMLLVMDSAMLQQGQVTLTITLQAKEKPGTVTFTCLEEVAKLPVTLEPQTHTLTLPISYNTIRHAYLTTTEDVMIIDYETK